MPLEKIVRKSKSWWRHGKHKGTAGLASQLDKQKAKPKRPQQWFSTVRDLMRSKMKKP